MRNEWLHTGAFNTPHSRRALHQRLAWLEQRIRRLPITPDQLGIQEDLDDLRHNVQNQNLHGYVDDALFDIVENEIGAWEQDLERCPFMPPTTPLDQGNVHVGNTLAGPLNINIARGEENRCNHILIPGKVYSGKTFILAGLAEQVADFANVVIVDSRNQFSQFPQIRQRFHFVPLRELRLNPFDLRGDLRSLPPNELPLTILRGMAHSFSWQFAEQEANEAAKELEEQGNLNVVSLRNHLKAKKYPFNSNRKRYAQTGEITITRLIDSTWPVFDCKEGMNLLTILTRGALVLKLDSIVSDQQAYVVRMIFDLAFMWSRAGVRLGKPLIIFIDEAQKLLERPEVADMLLTLRHANVYLVMCVQNPSSLPKEVFGNVDLHLVFGLTDTRDKAAVAQALNLDRNQMDYLSRLPARHAVFFLPRSPLRRASVVEVPFVGSDGIRDLPSAEFIKDLSWTPRMVDSQANASGNGLTEKEERLLRDVLTKEHAFSAMKARFERAGVRSASTQGQVIKKLIGERLLEVRPLAVGKGRPIKLCSGTGKAFELLGIKPWSCGRGTIATQAATEFLYQKLKKLAGWQVQREGTLE